MIKIDPIYESILLEKLKERDKTAFSLLFTAYYNDLVVFANSYLKDLAGAEEIVQDAFVKMWEECNSLAISSFKSYMLKMVYNKCVDKQRHLKVREKYSADYKEKADVFDFDPEHYMFGSELQQIIDKTLLKLPKDIADTFRMNRYDGLKYQEIADKLNVSLRTVEVRIGKALQLLRDHLKDYLIAFILCAFGILKP